MSTPGGPDARPLTVLVVDDNRLAARILARLARLEGYAVRVAGDGEAGLAAAVARPPDVALIDIGLPKMDGWELAGQLRRLVPAALLVAVTAYCTRADRERSRAAGFDYHFAKPVDLAALADLLQGHAGRLAAGDG